MATLVRQKASSTYAVLTGDVVNSTKLTAANRKKLVSALTAFFNTFKVKSHNALQLKITFEFYRGDSFQGAVNSPEQALLIALLVRTYLQGLVVFPKQLAKMDARIGIGIGKIKTWGTTLAESDGEAFQLSGRLLDSMKKMPNRIALKSKTQSLNDEMETSLLLLEGIIDRWTVAQAEVIHYKLQNHTDVAIAAILKVTQPTVSKHTKAAHWTAVEQLLNRYRALLTPKLR